MSNTLSFDDLEKKSSFSNDDSNKYKQLDVTQNSMDSMLALKTGDQRQNMLQSQHNVNVSHELGAGLVTQRLGNNPASTHTSFNNSYSTPVGSDHDKRQLEQNMSDYKNVDIDVFPPLLITYKPEHAYPDGRFASLKVGMGGELKPSKEGVPDIVINFHNPSGAITVSVFPVKNRDNFNNLKLVMSTLYAMKSPTPVTADEFLKIYSDTRTRLLNVISGLQ